MTCQALICVVDQRTPRRKGDHYRPFKHRPGEIICIRDNPCRWGRMEGPLGQSMVMEVNASARDLQDYTTPYANQPVLSWGIHGNHMECTVTFPDPLPEAHYEFLNRRFNRWTCRVSPYICVFKLFTQQEIVNFPRVFAREYRDKLLQETGPRFLMNERICQQVAWEGGFSRCDERFFRKNIIDRAEKRFDLRLAA